VLQPPVRVCFVCSGNICRSPTAEVALNRLAVQAGLTELLTVDSAGTGSWHAGDDMDARSRRTMAHAGYDVPLHAAKQFLPADFASRDIVVALDTGHYNVLWWLAAEVPDVAAARDKIVLLRSFDPELEPGEEPDVGDPYYGGPGGFREVLDQVERSCAALLSAIQGAIESGVDWRQQVDRPPR
jgi:protein-tyrosine phosphatase